MILDVCNYSKGCKKLDNGTCPIKNGSGEICLKKYKIEKLQDEALLSKKQRDRVSIKLDSSGVDRDAYNRLKEINDSIEKFVSGGKNLYLYSSITGNGKTMWSLRLLNSYLEKIWYKSDITCRALFISVPNFLIATKENFNQRQEMVEHIKQYVFDADLIVWDDIATKGFTVFETETILNYINGRINNGKANIYTSNLIDDELRHSIGDRLYSRVEELSEIIEFRGVDKRGVIV